VQRCDVTTGSCSPLESGLALPGAIAFDGEGGLWLLENVFDPTLRALAHQ
jgi:hypothetical protein